MESTQYCHGGSWRQQAQRGTALYIVVSQSFPSTCPPVYHSYHYLFYHYYHDSSPYSRYGILIGLPNPISNRTGEWDADLNPVGADLSVRAEDPGNSCTNPDQPSEKKRSGSYLTRDSSTPSYHFSSFFLDIYFKESGIKNGSGSENPCVCQAQYNLCNIVHFSHHIDTILKIFNSKSLPDKF